MLAYTKGQLSDLRAFIEKSIVKGDKKEVLYLIDHGRIRPSKSLQNAIALMLKGNKEFIMIDDQKVAYEEILHLSELSQKDGRKRTVIVQGGPGTGKTVIAVNLLAELTKVSYGRSADEVLVGDWDGDGIDTLAVRRDGNIYYFSNSINNPNAEVTRVSYGRAADLVLVGDWDGDGIDTLAVRRNGNIYYFSNSISNPDADVTVVSYGRAADAVYVGTWA
ncbi:MAG: DUF2075 domain-containing protein [Lachnospiraceae bacterium]|nr:DUF2075 domain-containing protein [Lachnospiraceae bacterium]